MSDSKEPMENIQDKIEHILLYGSIDDINKPIDDKGFTPLHYCVQGCGYNLPITTKYNELVKELLKSEANPDVQDNDGDTPLMIAAKFGDSFTMRELLVAGADPNIKNKDDMDPLVYCSDNAIFWRKGERPYDSLCIRLLLYYGYKFRDSKYDDADGNKYNLFEKAIEKNDIETVKYFLIDATNQIDLKDRNFLAVTETTEMIELLLRYGANPNGIWRDKESGDIVVPDELEDIPLAHTIARNNEIGTRILLNAGADPNLKAVSKNFGGNPLYISLIWGNFSSSTQILLESGADPNIKNRDGKSFIMSFLEDFKSNYSILLKHGASIDSDFLQRFCREIIQITKDNQLKKLSKKKKLSELIERLEPDQ